MFRVFVLILLTVALSAIVVNPAFTQKVRMPFPTSAPDSGSYFSPCAVDVFLNAARKDPQFKQREEAMNAAILRHNRMYDTALITLPVVFHIVADNPSVYTDAQVVAAIQNLNDAFSKGGPYAASAGADTRIRFCLANKDPDGGITTGITRTVSFFANDLNPLIEDAKLKNLVQWDASHYINIWFIRSMHLEIFGRFQCGSWLRMFAGGYATLPPGGGPTDGIVITATGDMLAHEMGHYLGLYHTFEGMDCANFDCTINGDRVCDTPPDASVSNSSSCGAPQNSCTTDTLSGFTVDKPDNIANFMDYGNSSCHNEFTQGQTDRMRAAIATQRAGLLVDQCAAPCSDAVLASFTRDNPYPLPGDAINFANNSSGATSYEWLVNGISTTATPNFSTSFTLPGKYKVTLKAITASGCYSTFSQYVIVNCGVTARFYTDKRQIASIAPKYLDSIRFTNTSVNATSYRWLMANDKGMTEQVIGTAKDFTYVFAVPGNYTVRLIATNGACTDTSGLFTIPVTDPTPDAALYLWSVECYQQTKVRVGYYVCNSGNGGLPKNIPISFYEGDPRTATARKLNTVFLADSIPGNCCGFLYTTIVDVGHRGLNSLYAVFNDSGKVAPVVFPGTALIEKSYFNNIALYSGFAFKVTATPALSVMEWGDTVQLNAIARPGLVASYAWSTKKDLTCTSCSNPLLIADSATTKQVIATSQWGCTDTTTVAIQVPPYNDFSIEINDAQCAKGDSLRVSFTIRNSFKRAVIPKGLTVAFYSGDPTGSASMLLPKLFTVPDTVKAGSAVYTTAIKGMVPGKLYAAVNDSGKVTPVVLPHTPFLEKAYGNNFGSFNYKKFTVSTYPASFILEWQDTVQLSAVSGPGTDASYVWSNGYNLNCVSCAAPFMIADTSSIKRVVGTNAFGCRDTAYVTISVPPYNDFSVQINNAQCKGGDSILVDFTLSNAFKRPFIPKGLTVAFFKGDPTGSVVSFLPKYFVVPDTVKGASVSYTTVIKGMPPGKLYAAVNDSGKVLPITFPFQTTFLEKAYGNNFGSFDYKRFSVTPVPSTAILEWRDTLQLTATAGPGVASSFTWSPAYNLSCAVCSSPFLVADTNNIKQVVARSALGCSDTAYVTIQVPPYNDFTVRVDDVQCARGDSLFVTFTISNSFKRPLLPKTLSVAFYDGDPATASAIRLSPVFSLPDTLFSKSASFSTFIKGMNAGKLYAVINDSAKALPVSFPATLLLEKTYNNNTTAYNYQPEAINILPADTTVMRKHAFGLKFTNTLYNPASTLWSCSLPNTLNCTACTTPVITVLDMGTISAQTENRYGCMLKGSTTVKILPPDLQVKILDTKCYRNGTALVTFSICMNNNYDSVWKDIPVSFYDGHGAGGRPLQPLFVTPQLTGDTCFTFTTKVQAPPSGKITAVVNDLGDNPAVIPSKRFVETDYINNWDTSLYLPFTVFVNPADSAIDRLSSLQLHTSATGGQLSSYLWKPSLFLDCTTCAAPVATPAYTMEYLLTAKNEWYCTDTAIAIVRTHTQTGIYMPNTFTPNADGRNDIFYVLCGAEVSEVKTFMVYNRWGQPMYSRQNFPANNPLYGWNGKLNGEDAPPQAYVWYLEVRLKDGTVQAAKGTVMLVR